MPVQRATLNGSPSSQRCANLLAKQVATCKMRHCGKTRATHKPLSDRDCNSPCGSTARTTAINALRLPDLESGGKRSTLYKESRIIAAASASRQGGAACVAAATTAHLPSPDTVKVHQFSAGNRSINVSSTRMTRVARRERGAADAGAPAVELAERRQGLPRAGKRTRRQRESHYTPAPGTAGRARQRATPAARIEVACAQGSQSLRERRAAGRYTRATKAGFCSRHRSRQPAAT
jgi:hypothetical protein